MRMTEYKSRVARCSFETERLSVEDWKSQVVEPSSEQDFAKKVISILS